MQYRSTFFGHLLHATVSLGSKHRSRLISLAPSYIGESFRSKPSGSVSVADTRGGKGDGTFSGAAL